MTGCAPAELMAGGRDYFDALVQRADNRMSLGYESTELLATLVEVTFASYRALLALAGVKNLPEQIKVPRPGTQVRKRGSVADLREWVRTHGG